MQIEGKFSIILLSGFPYSLRRKISNNTKAITKFCTQNWFCKKEIKMIRTQMIALSLCNRPAHPDDLDLFTKKVLYSRSSLLQKKLLQIVLYAICRWSGLFAKRNPVVQHSFTYITSRLIGDNSDHFREKSVAPDCPLCMGPANDPKICKKHPVVQSCWIGRRAPRA